MFKIFSGIYKTKNGIVSNEKPDKDKISCAIKILTDLQKDISLSNDNSGPFVAAIYDENNNFITKCSNSVIKTNCSNNHAEINVIKSAEEIFANFDLSSYNLKLYVTSEPCMMCLGAILASGIKEIYFGVPTKVVEKITGFDEGFKPNWLCEFKKRGVIVYGNIEPEIGKQELKNYVKSGKKIYKPAR